MKMNKILSAMMSAVMIGSTAAANTAFAAEADAAKTYNYVALGDSIAAGFGLAGGDIAQDPALVITDELLENPVKGAYPALLADKIKAFGKERGYSVKGTNLASTAFRAADIKEVIKTPGYKGQFASTILENYLGEGASEVLAPYHDIYNKYLTEADLVSIQLGGNDIIMSIVPEMVFGENPVLRAAGTSLMLTLFGMDPEIAVGGGLQVIQEAGDTITTDDFIEAAAFMYNVGATANELVDKSSAEVKEVVEAVKDLNGSADIALVGMFNPYKSNFSEDMAAQVSEVLGKIYNEAAKAAAGSEDQLNQFGQTTKDYIGSLSDRVGKLGRMKSLVDLDRNDADFMSIFGELADSEDAAAMVDYIAASSDENYNDAANTLFDMIDTYEEPEAALNDLQIVRDFSNISDLEGLLSVMSKYRTANDTAAAKAMASQIAGPMVMQMAGKNVDPQMQRLNENLKGVAGETGAIYVDVYGISPEDDFDPHPNANGHSEIADIIFNTLTPTFNERMPLPEVPQEEPTTEPVVEIPREMGDVDGNGIVDFDDASYITAHVIGIRPLSAEELKYADMDGSGNIDMIDMLMVITKQRGITGLYF